MNKLIFLLTFVALLLTGCHSTSKDEKYNNMTANEIYKLGTKHVRKKNYPEAVEDFEALESRYPFSDLADKAQLGAIYAYYLNDDYPSALPAVERFLRMYPRHPHVDYAYYMKGLIHYNESLGYFSKYLPMEQRDRDVSSAKKGLVAFQTLISQYPDSIYTNEAKQRMIYLRNLLAESDLVVARYYLRKGAYLASANRAGFILAQYDQSPSMPEALAIMVQAYRKLHLHDLANDAYQVLVYNYPDSEFAKQLSA